MQQNRRKTLRPSAPAPLIREPRKKSLRPPLEPPKLKAISASRDSDGKEERLREWREANGEEEEPRRRPSHNARAHKRNRWTAAKYGLDVVRDVSSIESAAEVGTRGDEIISAAREEGATVVIIPSLRRLGVGVAQVILRTTLEDAGLTIVTEDDAQNAILQSAPSPTRDRLLMEFAAADQFEWATNKIRLAAAHIDHHDTPAWQATLAFIEARSDDSLSHLAAVLESRGFETLTGKTRWYPQQVKLARAEIAAPKAAAPLREGSTNGSRTTHG